MARDSKGVWARRVARWSKSGLSRREFAAREGVNPETLGWWRWFLRTSGGEATKTTLAKRDVSFLEVEPIVVEVARERIEIALANGRVVRVPAVFADDVLGRIVAIAERA